MTGAEGIKEKILADADAECAKIRAAADAECAQIRAEADEAIAAQKARSDERVAAETAAKRRIAGSVAELAVKKESLAAKLALIEKTFASAVESLKGRDADGQLALLVRLAGECDIAGGEILRPSRAADKLLGERLIKAINGGLKGKSVVAGEPTDEVSSGFILESPNARQICSYEAVAELYREELEPRVAELLFGE